jgi:hypothetical protein
MRFFPWSFSPLSLSPALWLSDTGSDPAIWPDISGNGRNATQGTAGNQPAIISGGLNGRQVRRFNGSTSRLEIGQFLSGAATAFYVCKRVTDPAVSVGTTGPVLGDWGTAAGSFGNHFPWTDGVIYDHFGTAARKTCGNPTVSLTSWRLISQLTAASDWRFYIDGSLFFSTDANNVAWRAGPKIGVSYNYSYYYYGDIAEILIFPTALSPADRLAVERYLGAKWGITVA